MTSAEGSKKGSRQAAVALDHKRPRGRRSGDRGPAERSRKGAADREIDGRRPSDRRRDRDRWPRIRTRPRSTGEDGRRSGDRGTAERSRTAADTRRIETRPSPWTRKPTTRSRQTAEDPHLAADREIEKGAVALDYTTNHRDTAARTIRKEAPGRIQRRAWR